MELGYIHKMTNYTGYWKLGKIHTQQIQKSCTFTSNTTGLAFI